MTDKRIQYNEKVVGAGHPTLTDVANRLALVNHAFDGTHAKTLEQDMAGLISVKTPSGGGRVREFADVTNAATIGAIEIGVVYNADFSRKTVTSLTRSGSTATAMAAGHGYSNGNSILIQGADQTEYNGTFTISNVTTDTFDYTVTGTPATPATGVIDATNGTWAGRDITGACWLEKWLDDGTTKEFWYAPSAAAGAAPVWEKKLWMDIANGRIVGGKIFACQHTPVTINGTTSTVTLYSVTIPGGVLGKNGVLKVTTLWSHRNNSGVKNKYVYYGGTSFFARADSTSDTMSILTIIKNRNNVASQIGLPEVQYVPYYSYSAPWATLKLGSVNSDADQLVEVKGACALEASASVTSLTRSGSTATATVAAHGFSNGDYILIVGANEAAYNGTFIISNVTTNTFDYTVTGTPATPATGTITVQRYGKLTLEAVTVEVER